MAVLTATVGIPASGKSTWAKKMVDRDPGRTVRVNRDDLRSMLHQGEWNRDKERATVAVRDAAIRDLLEMGFNVICDDTNVQPGALVKLEGMARGASAEFEIVSFLDVPYGECLVRDRLREATVGEDVIARMHRDASKINLSSWGDRVLAPTT